MPCPSCAPWRECCFLLLNSVESELSFQRPICSWRQYACAGKHCQQKCSISFGCIGFLKAPAAAGGLEAKPLNLPLQSSVLSPTARPLLKGLAGAYQSTRATSSALLSVCRYHAALLRGIRVRPAS